MKKYMSYIIAVASILLLLSACSKDEQQYITEETRIAVDDVFAAVGELDIELNSTRAVGDYYANNNTYDPTRSLPAKGDDGWLLDLTIYHADTVYQAGSKILEYDRPYSASSVVYGYWKVPNNDILFLPNYKTQKFEAMLYPPGWQQTTTIALDQRDTDVFRRQDILDAYMGKTSATTPIITPAKSIEITFKHYYTMLNFKLGNIDYSKIRNLRVLVDNNNDNNYTEYIPYQVKHLTTGKVVEGEYMTIIYPDKKNIQIILTTNDGIEYHQQLKFPSNHNSGRGQQNYCYCFTLTGIELVLSPITVKNWATGETIDAGYTTETAYPTFLGPKDTTYTLWYDNGLSQEITFSSQGECIVLPIGRTIKFIECNGIKTELNNPITLESMLIDLNNFS